ncbi:MAG: sulfite exporter TauE/SafE family protein [Gammaproteobacteria bacterium]|nr:sulfite exporter TauE/SafE family protein [Gammaproteobacteria bacterium]
MDITTLALSLLAGLLTTLSPCVLPLLPVLVAAALGQHRLGPLALAAGLALAFAGAGVVLASAGFALGLSGGLLRQLSAALMLLVALWLLSSRLQRWLSAMLSRWSASGQQRLAQVEGKGLAGQFGLGLLLGLVWTPCVGPTLGAAIALASQGQALAQVTLVMVIFSLGAVIPFIALGSMGQALFNARRGRWLTLAAKGKQIMGWTLLLLALLVLSGLDKTLETALLDLVPDWWSELSIRY